MHTKLYIYICFLTIQTKKPLYIHVDSKDRLIETSSSALFTDYIYLKSHIPIWDVWYIDQHI